MTTASRSLATGSALRGRLAALQLHHVGDTTFGPPSAQKSYLRMDQCKGG